MGLSPELGVYWMPICPQPPALMLATVRAYLKHAEYVKFSSTVRDLYMMSLCGTKPIMRLCFSSRPGLHRNDSSIGC